MTRKVQLLLAAALVLAGGAGAMLLVKTAPKAQRQNPDAPAATVEVAKVEQRQAEARVAATGTVGAAQRVTITPQVSGTLVALSQDLAPGTRFAAGDVIARIDPRDYELAIRQRRADVRQAELALQQEQARHQVAEKEWEALGQGQPAEQAPLALREPQLETAKIQLEAAQSALAKAELDLQRTVLRAPFDAVVVDKQADIGQSVGPSTRIVTLVGTSRAWIRASLPVEQLRHIEIPGVNAEAGSKVEVVQKLADGTRITRQGCVHSLVGTLDPQTRTAQLLVELDNPFEPASDALPLLPEAYVELEIAGKSVADVYRVPRAALHEGDAIWVVDAQDQLQKRPVEIRWGGDEHVWVSGQLGTVTRVVVSPLPNPVAGMAVHPVPSGAASSTAANSAAPAPTRARR